MIIHILEQDNNPLEMVGCELFWGLSQFYILHRYAFSIYCFSDEYKEGNIQY